MTRWSRSRALRLTGRILGGAALSLTFVVAGVSGLALHADLPLTRRLAARFAGQALSSVLGGTVTFDPFSELGLTRITVPHATLLDAYSAKVLTLTDVRVDLSMRRIVQELLFDRSRPTVILDHIRVERADVTLIADPKTGEPTIARAIAPIPNKSGAPSTGTTSDAESGLRVYLPVIEIGLVTGHGQLADQRALSVRVTRVQGLLLGTPKGLAVDVKRFGMVLRGFGADARGTGTLAIRAPGPMRGTFEGFFGGVELKANAFLDGVHVEGAVDVPRATPEAASRLFPGWPLRDAVSGHIDVKGDLPSLALHAALQAESATIDVDGPIYLGVPETATLTVKSRHLDARLLSAGSPPTDLSLDATLTARRENGVLVASGTAHTDRALVAGQLVPAMDVEASWKDDVASGTAQVHEPGVPLTASFRASKAGVADVDFDTGPMNFSRLPRLTAPDVRGTGRARVHAHIEAGAVRATVDADVAGVSIKGARMARAHVTAQVTGKLDALDQARGTVHVAGTGATFGTLPADRLTLDARGGRSGLEFDAGATQEGGPELHAKGTATFAERLLFRNTKVSLRRDPVVIEGDIEELDPSVERLDVRNVHVAGAGGTMTGSVRLGPDLIEVEANGENVDLDALGRSLGLARGTLGGRMRVSVSVVTGHDVTRGHVRFGLGNATIGTVGGLSAQVSADLDGTHLTGDASGLVANIATFGATWDTELGGPAFEPESWRDVTGRSEVQVGSVNLPLLAALLPRDGPVTRIGGEGFARVLLDRKTAAQKLPNVFATVATRGLAIDVRGATAPTHIAGIDVTATGALDGTTGDSTGTTLAADAHGDLLTATGAIRLDIDRLLADPKRALAQLVDTPVDMVVSLHPRLISDLPEWMRPAGVVGTVGSNVSIRGTFAKPTLFGSIDGAGIEAAGAVVGGHPVDLNANGEYEWNSHAFRALGSAGVGGRTVATASLRGVLPDGRLEAWTGDGRLDLQGLPLELLLAFGRNEVTGQLQGHATLQRTATSGALEADVTLAGLSVAGAALGQGRLQLATTGDTVPTVHGTFDVSSERGTLQADATAGVTYQSGLPGLVPMAPLHGHVVAHDFSAIVLTPLVRSVSSRIGGRIEATVNVSLEPHPGEGGKSPTWSGGLDGKATLSEGSALIDLLGLDVRDLAFAVEARGQGKTTNVSLRDLHGRVRSTSDNVRGNAELVMSGLDVEHGTGQLTVNDVPLLFRGALQGHVTGQAGLRLERDGDRIVIDVDVPKLTTRLPPSSARNVVDLADNPDVTILQLTPDDSARAAATAWRVVLHLGSDVRLQRADIDLGVGGDPTIDLGNAVEVSGSVELTPGGRVPVLGKVFVVDHGRLIFDTGEPTNPRLDVSASWRSPNGTVVSVDVTGTLDDAKIATRSDPPLPKTEVDALLLGGSSSESGAVNDPNASGGGAAASAVALGTGVAALGVNQLLSNNPVELRVESTSESRPRYTAAVRVRENLWFEASTYQETDRSAASGTDRSVYSGTVDYRFTPRWSLRTEAGTAGGAMDLLWQYRY